MGIAYNTSIVTSGLVFALDAGNTRCYSGSGNTAFALAGNITGTLTGSVGFGTTNQGFFVFNDSDHISLGNPTILQGLQINMTLSCWFRQQSNVTYGTLYSDYSAVNNNRLVSLLRVDGGSLVYYTSKSDGGYQSVIPGAITNGTWYFASVTIGGTISAPTASIFVNGTTYSYNLSALSSSPFTGSTHCIGGNVYNNETFNGSIAQVMIYNRALSAQEISQNFNATRDRYGI